MKLSIVIPAYNEEESITETIVAIEEAFKQVKIDHEIFVVNDNSKDNTIKVLEELCKKIPSLKYETNNGPNGFGYAVRYGLERFSGDWEEDVDVDDKGESMWARRAGIIT